VAQPGFDAQPAGGGRQKRRDRRQPHRQRGQAQRRQQPGHGGPGADRTPSSHASMILAVWIVSDLF